MCCKWGGDCKGNLHQGFSLWNLFQCCMRSSGQVRRCFGAKKKTFIVSSLSVGTTEKGPWDTWRWNHYAVSKRREPNIHWRSVTSKKIRYFNSITDLREIWDRGMIKRFLLLVKMRHYWQDCVCFCAHLQCNSLSIHRSGTAFEQKT
jgi:hypothetical protein